jgi:hypothetical protein
VTPAARRFARFVGTEGLVTGALYAVGWLPTSRLTGSAGVAAMGAGCGLGLLSAAAAGWLLTAFDGPTAEARMQRAMLAMCVRLAVLLAGGVAVAVSGVVPRSPLLFWMAAAYVVLLPLEVRLAIP